MAECFGDHFCYVHQAPGDLGAKLAVATSSANQPTVVVGTDCPDLNAETMQRAFQALQSTDVVLGPASDGGYYLLGLKEPQPALFSDIPWGTDRVCKLTQTIARGQGLSVCLLEVLDDIDRPADFQWLDRGLREALLGAD
jgi:rSAM/selenodomain-associated transferase 1